MSRLLLVTGPPGAGKSTVARQAAGCFEPSALVAGDEFFHFLVRGAIAPWLPEAHDQNETTTRASAAAAGAYVSGGLSTVFDGIVGPWHLHTFGAATGLAELHYAILLPSADRCAARVAARADHGFDDEAATRHMHQEFSDAAIDERHVLRDPPDVVAEVLDELLARFHAGSLRIAL